MPMIIILCDIFVNQSFLAMFNSVSAMI